MARDVAVVRAHRGGGGGIAVAAVVAVEVIDVAAACWRVFNSPVWDLDLRCGILICKLGLKGEGLSFFI